MQVQNVYLFTDNVYDYLFNTRNDMSVSEHEQKNIWNSDKYQRLRDNPKLLTDNHYICKLSFTNVTKYD